MLFILPPTAYLPSQTTHSATCAGVLTLLLLPLATSMLHKQERLSKIEREAGKQHGFLASVEKLAAAVDITKRAPTTSGISR